MYEWETKESDGMKFVPGDAKVLPQFKLIDVKLKKLYTQYVIGMSLITPHAVKLSMKLYLNALFHYDVTSKQKLSNLLVRVCILYKTSSMALCKRKRPTKDRFFPNVRFCLLYEHW